MISLASPQWLFFCADAFSLLQLSCPRWQLCTGVFSAGDCLRQGPGSHGAKGLCQEKAYATGLQAGNNAAQFLGFTPRIEVLQPEKDEEHVVAAREALRAVREASKLWPRLDLIR